MQLDSDYLNKKSGKENLCLLNKKYKNFTNNLYLKLLPM